MAANEELQEHVHAAHDSFEKTVAGTMAIIAALLATVSVLGQHFNTEELLHEQQSADQWAFSQAKDIRRYSAQIAQDSFAASKADPALVRKYNSEGARYDDERRKIQETARELHEESLKNGRRSNRVHVGEVLLEIAIVLSSLSILTKARLFYWIGAVAGATGLLVAATAWF